jgi:hypothetical protein
MVGDGAPSAHTDGAPSTAAHDADPYAHARRLGGRAARGLILVLAVLFVGSSAWQLVRAIFVEGGATAPAYVLDPTCASGVHRLVVALDRAADRTVSAAARAMRPDEGVAMFRRELSPEWDTADVVERTCASSQGGEDAWAALQRLRSAEEQLARQSRTELAPLRHDLAAHLPADLR